LIFEENDFSAELNIFVSQLKRALAVEQPPQEVVLSRASWGYELRVDCGGSGGLRGLQLEAGLRE
jgi:hypothetical protein